MTEQTSDEAGRSGHASEQSASDAHDVTDAQRRRVLAALGTAGTVAVAGCLGVGSQPGRQGGDLDFGSSEGGAGGGEGGESEGTPTPAATTYDIEYAKEGATIEVGEEEALLYAGLDEGWDLPYSCERGICGQCTAKVDGDGSELATMESNDYLSEAQVEAGFVLTCTGNPDAAFTLETDMQDAADEFEESGGSTGDETETETPTPAAVTYEVEFVKQGASIEVGEEEALLYAGLDEGWDLPYNCEHGFCGECTAKIDGDATELVTHGTNEVLSEEEMKEGYMLTCTGNPDADFAIETGEQP